MIGSIQLSEWKLTHILILPSFTKFIIKVMLRLKREKEVRGWERDRERREKVIIKKMAEKLEREVKELWKRKS